jgi:hypothetical protein
MARIGKIFCVVAVREMISTFSIVGALRRIRIGIIV